MWTSNRSSAIAVAVNSRDVRIYVNGKGNEMEIEKIETETDKF